ncbi:glycosyltransferase family 4 protein [Microbacterium sp. KHB019]|uniref:glycosyltransferase family 4 protein n=1 Tax=Microbacterium sp. KHB019 TaxID=3129770 RepID=UPI00307A9404
MRILVYPHDLDMGGSQLNAIELAAAVTRLGHECMVYGRPGALCARIEELGLEFIEAPEPGRRPSLRVARDIRRLIRERGIDIVHGYEWPTGLEAALAVESEADAAAICTVMSMAVAPFLPTSMPLFVGTQQISAAEQARGRRAVDLLEPPVDLAYNAPLPPAEIAAFRSHWGLDERPIVVCVSRLVPDLKAEGIFTAIEATAELPGAPFQLLIVGDGASRQDMEDAARRAAARSGRASVVFTGELTDPRAAYAAADIVLGMGGSALRALAFEKPLIVQGEQGFFRPLSAETVDTFLWQGWYGIGDGHGRAVDHLIAALQPLLADRALRRERGVFGREVVERFSLEATAGRMVACYRDLWADRDAQKRRRLSATASALRFARYRVLRRLDGLRGRRRTDDFNAVPVASADSTARGARTASPASGPIVYFAGAAWDHVAGTDRQIVAELSEHREVIWIDPPQSPFRGRGRPASRASNPQGNITRLRGVPVPSNHRPVLRTIADRWCVRELRQHCARHGIHPSAVVCASSSPSLALTRDLPGVKVYYATDDFVEAGALWGVSQRYLASAREANLRAADLVLAVTPELGRRLQRTGRASLWLPNGADLDHAGAVVERAEDVRLSPPIAGVAGQFNARTDFSVLEAVQQSGVSLLLVGPRRFHMPEGEADFERLIGQPGVQWVDSVPKEELPAYLAWFDAGLTPYADTMFNRRSYPLKTVEYLAAGIPVVATDVAPTDGLDERFVRIAASAGEFAAATVDLLANDRDREAIQRSVAHAAWGARAEQLLAWIDEEGER